MTTAGLNAVFSSVEEDPVKSSTSASHTIEGDMEGLIDRVDNANSHASRTRGFESPAQISANTITNPSLCEYVTGAMMIVHARKLQHQRDMSRMLMIT